jgi:hypothetical protein
VCTTPQLLAITAAPKPGDCVEVFADDAWWRSKVTAVLAAADAPPADAAAAAAAGAAAAAAGAGGPAVAAAAVELLVKCWVVNAMLTVPVKV